MTEVELLTQISGQLTTLLANLDKYALILVALVGLGVVQFLWPRR